jgi:hypothetical protein
MKLVVDKESLVSVADAIREKGGTSESLTFPQGFVDGIGAIESGGGTEEIENIIDASGVLESTDGTATEKVERLIDKAEWENVWYKQTERIANASSLFLFIETATIPRSNLITSSQFISFCKDAEIEYIDYYLNTQNGTNFMDCFRNCKKLKRMVGINTAKATQVIRLFLECNALEKIEEPLNFSSVHSANSQDACFGGANSLVDIRFVAESIKWSIAFPSAVLSDESVQSIIDGLAYVESSQNLTLSNQIVLTDNQKQVINAKGWTLIQ